MKTQEIECRFLEIDKNSLVEKLLSLGALDEGEKMLEERIFYDPELTWKTDKKLVRLRKVDNHISLTYKEHNKTAVDGTYELEVSVDDMDKAGVLLEKVGLKAFRHQEKKRHTFKLGDVTVDIDTWPRIPTYVEFEAGSEEDLKKTVEAIGYDWQDAVFEDAAMVIEGRYNIPVRSMSWFTFDRFE